jgi:hypothetical protein
MAGVFTFGVFADNHPVQIVLPDISEGGNDAGQNACRTDIGVLIKPLADREPQAPEGDMIRETWIAYRAEVNRVSGAEPG